MKEVVVVAVAGKETIIKFREEYEFLSNMFKTPIDYLGMTFTCVEAAFQAAKCPERAKEFVSLNGYGAKNLGKKVKLVPNWDEKKLNVMEEILRIKFSNPELREKLLETGLVDLEEGNDWFDTYWGICQGQGKNHLGEILMKIRNEIREETGYTNTERIDPMIVDKRNALMQNLYQYIVDKDGNVSYDVEKSTAYNQYLIDKAAQQLPEKSRRKHW